MKDAFIDQAIDLLEKTNADFDPESYTLSQARELLATCSRGRKLFDFLIAGLARKVDDAAQFSRVTGTSMGKAKETIATGKVASQSDALNTALRQGAVSLDQAVEIAKAEESAPGSAQELIAVAKEQSFHVLKEKARRAKLEAEQHKDLAAHQRAARSAHSRVDDLGMVNVHLSLEPHVGTPIVARADAEAERLLREAKQANQETEPFERYLADAYARLLEGSGKGRARRPELVVLVSHEVAKRGWKDVREGEHCRIPGVGPVAPEVAREIAADAFLNGVFYDGKDLRHFRRWTKHIPIEVLIALELGEPPDFDGVRCVDCGALLGNQMDHVRPRSANGPTSKPNLDWRCWRCHLEKTKRERAAARARHPLSRTHTRRPGLAARVGRRPRSP